LDESHRYAPSFQYPNLPLFQYSAIGLFQRSNFPCPIIPFFRHSIVPSRSPARQGQAAGPEGDLSKQSQFPGDQMNANHCSSKGLGEKGVDYARGKTKPIPTRSFKQIPRTSHSVRAGLKGFPNALHRIRGPQPAPIPSRPPHGVTTSGARCAKQSQFAEGRNEL
jgi:hypothetical protein